VLEELRAWRGGGKKVAEHLGFPPRFSGRPSIKVTATHRTLGNGSTERTLRCLPGKNAQDGKSNRVSPEGERVIGTALVLDV